MVGSASNLGDLAEASNESWCILLFNDLLIDIVAKPFFALRTLSRYWKLAWQAHLSESGKDEWTDFKSAPSIYETGIRKREATAIAGCDLNKLRPGGETMRRNRGRS